jgi:hypothetical protein
MEGSNVLGVAQFRNLCESSVSALYLHQPVFAVTHVSEQHQTYNPVSFPLHFIVNQLTSAKDCSNVRLAAQFGNLCEFPVSALHLPLTSICCNICQQTAL